MRNKSILILSIFMLLFINLCAEETTPKVILNDKTIINEKVKAIDDKGVVLDSGINYKSEDVQEVFLRIKSELNSGSLLLLNNESMIYFNELTFIDNKISVDLLSKKINLPIGNVKAIIYKNMSGENNKVWKKYFAEEIRKSDIVFVLKDEKLIPIECVIKEIEKDKIKILWDGKEKAINTEKVVQVLFASISGDNSVKYELQIIEGTKIVCQSLKMNSEGIVTIGFSNKDETIILSETDISRILFINRKITFLSTLEPTEIISEKILIELNSYFEKNQSIWKKPLSIAGRVYVKGVGVHALCKLKYKIPEGSIQFITDCGIDSEVINNSGCIFSVIVDKKVFFKEILKTSDGAKNVIVDIPANSQELILIVVQTLCS